MHRLFLVSLIVLAFSRPLFAQGGPGQSNYPISQQTGSGAPSGTCPGTNVEYLNIATGTIYSCPVPGGNWTAVASGGGFPVVGAVTVNNGGSISPSGTGQNVANQVWAGDYNQQAPTVTISATGQGGSFISGHGAIVQITFVSASGETLAGPIGQSGSCGAGGGCTATVTAPTIPSGFTGYTVYSCDSSVTGICSSVSAPEKQLASPNCVNITGNCVISTPGTGANVPTVATAYIQPPNAQASTCAPQVSPITMWLQGSNGDYYSAAGVNPATGNSRTFPTLTFCNTTFFDDTQSNQPGGNNAFVLITHNAGTNVATNNDDRALGVFITTPTNDSATRYALEAINAENEWNCDNCTINGSPDGVVSVFDGNINNNASTDYADPTAGVEAARLQYFKLGAGYGSSANYTVRGVWAIDNGTFPSGATGAGIDQELNNSTGAAVNNFHFTHFLAIFANQTGAITNGQTAFAAPFENGLAGSFNAFATNGNAGLPSFLNGPLQSSNLFNNTVGSFAIDAAADVTGSLTMTQATAPTISGVSCSGGSSQYTYELVAVDGNGGAVASAAVSTPGSTCTNPLTSGNPASISITNTYPTAMETQAGFVRVDIYRTGGPMSTGKIGSLTCSTLPINLLYGGESYCSSFSDTGLSASGTAPSTNTTGGIFTPSGAVSHLGGNVAQLTTNFTTAANTSLQTFLSFNLGTAAANYSFHCVGSYSQATGTASDAFGIQAATNAPTNIFATGTQQTSTSTAPVPVTLATLSTTTATNVTTGTPGATSTNYRFEIDGTIQEPAEANGNVLNFMVSTGTSADVLTVLQGSYCELF